MPTATAAELEAQRAALGSSIKAIFDRADGERRPLNATEAAQVAALEKLHDGVNATPNPRKTKANPIGVSNSVSGYGQRTTQPDTARTMAEWFPESANDYGGFSSFGDFSKAVRFGDATRLMAATGQNSTIGSDGGFAVPPAMSFELLDASIESEIIRPRATVIPMMHGSVVCPMWDDHTHASGELFGGLKGSWTAEGGTLPVKVAELRQIALKAAKLGYLTACTNELLSDAPGFAGRLQKRMTDALSFNLDTAFVSGTGAGQPLGILNSSCLITVSKEAGQLPDTLQYENILNMFARLPPSSMPRAVWLASQTTIPQLMSMFIGVAIFGPVVPVLQKTASGYEILGRPVIFSEKLPTIGDLGDLILADLSQYVIGLAGDGMRMAASNDHLFATDEVAFRITVRANGQPSWAQAFQPYLGSTLSPFVALQAR